MNFRRFLRHLFSFSQFPTIRRSGSHRNKSKNLNRVHLETLEDRFNPSQMFWPDLSASTGGMPFQVQTVDLNNDGKFDYVAATNGGITVGLGLGGGAFSAGSIISLGTTPKALAFGDFNADTKLDIVTANEATDSITLLLGDGSGGFQPGASFKVGNSPKAIAVGKFEGASDTTLDIVTANYGSDNLTILLGNGPGTFKAGIQVGTGSDTFPVGVAVGEFNGDANPDIVAVNSGTSTALLFTGNGNGNFAKVSTAITLNGAPESVIVGDFNKNGKLDFAATSSNNNAITVAMGNGNGTFVVAPTLNLGSDKGPTGLVTGDFNGDNLPDLATANRFNNSVAVFAGNGDGKFKAAAFFPAGGGALSLAVEDFNGDTKADLLTANPIDNTLALLAGNGSGGFAAPLSIALGGPANAVVLGDLNGDGKADVAAANTSGESVTVFWGNGNGSLAPGLVLKTGKAPESISLLDFNGDSKLDIVADTVDNVVVFLSQGNGAFATPVVLSAGSSPVGVFGNDFNADAKIDLVVANAGENTISLFAGKGDGSFVAPVKVAVGNGPDSITSGDFNGDGKVDLAVANFQDNTVSVLLGNGNTTFQGQKTYAVGVNPTSLGAGDFNGDGTLDLVTTDNGGNTLSVLFGNKDGTFQSAKTFGVGASPGTLVVRDFNGDNKVDLSFTETGSNAVSVLLSNGNGTFAGPFGYSVGSMPLGLAWGDLDGDNKADLVSANSGTGNLSILLSKGDGSFKGATTVGVGLSPNGLARGDFNNDGKMDIATANFGDNKISVLLSAGQGKFLPVVNYGAGSGPISIVAVDLNNDGVLDLVSANNSGNPDGSFDVSILLGNSNGSFKAATFAAVGANPVSVAFGDFNGDGKMDLLTANQGDGDVTLLLGNGDGKFQAGKSLLAGGAAPQAIIARDLNGDGKLDYTVSALGDNKLYSYLGNGNGTFLSGIGIEAGQAPFSIDTGDFNKDGKVDLVSASAAGNDVSLLLGNGDGKFKIAVSLFSGAGPYSVTTGDFDGDGNLDIAAANSGDSALAVLLGNGNGTFEAPVRNTVGSNPYGIVWGDFDGDKRIDLATANSNTNNVSVLYNFFDLKGGVVNPSTSATFVEGITGQFQIEGQGSPRPTFAITAGALPTGMKLDTATGLISGIPAVGTSDASPYSFTVTATNSVGSGSKTFSFNVQKTSGIAPIITSANSTTFTYGATGSFTITATGTPAPTFSVTSGTLPSGITLNGTTGLLSGKANAGVYNFTITASNNINPAATQAFTLTVNPAALTITAEDKTKVYGAALPGLTVKVDGLVNGDTIASITGLGASTKATASSPVGKYAITPAGTNPNYKITLVEGNLSVTKAALTISAEDKTKVYGADLPTLTTKIEGLVNGDTAASITGLTATTVATKASKVGDYAIIPAGTNANYDIKLVNGNLTVTKAALTITAEDKTKVYGAALPTLTTKVEGLVNGDTTASITGLGATTSATKASKVGDYDITPAGTNANYNIKLVDGTLTVTKAALTITAENKTKVYGAAVPALTTVVTGLVNGDTTASISGLGATTSATKTSKVGNYAITPAGTNANYEIKLVDGTLAVGKAKLTITPNNLEKTKGSTLTFAGTEFATSPFAVDGDKVSKVTLTSPGAASTAAVGKYDIVGSDPTGTGLENYDITLEKGVFTVVPINTAPSGGDKSVTFDEDTDYKIAVGDFGFSDPVDGDNLKTVKFTVLPTKGTLKLNGVALVKDQEVKAADIASGLLVFSPGANQNGAKFATVQFQVRDDGGTANGGVDLDPTANTLTINVTSVNDAPTGADKTITINEDTAYPLTVADFGFADASDSPANAFKAVIIRALPNNGSLKLNGVTVTLNQGITTDLIAAGKLIFSPDKDESGVGYGKIEFRVQDNGGTTNGGVDTDPSAQAITFNVTSVNDTPVITSPLAVSLQENNKLAQVVTATDPDPNTTITFSLVGGADKGLFSIDAKTGALNFLTAPNFEAPTDFDKNNSYQVQVRVSDGTLFDTETVTVSVTNVNEAPTITAKGPFSIDEGKTAVGKIVATDPDAGAKITYSLAGGADSALFTINATTGELAFAKAPSFDLPLDANKDNKYELVVRASDGSLDDTDSVTVTVLNVNVAPVITSPLAVSLQENNKLAEIVTASDLDANQTITFSLVGGADKALFSIDAKTGALNFLTEPNFEAPTDADKNNSYIVQVRATDNGVPALFDTEFVTVTVTNVNEAPTITAKGPFSIDEGKTAVGKIAATDPDAGAKITYSLAGGADSALFTINATTGELAFAKAPSFDNPLDANDDNKYELVVRASDGSLDDTDSVTVTVLNVNVAPVITSPLAVSLPENNKLAQIVTASDLDANTTITFSLVGGADKALFSIDAKTGALNFLTAANFEAPTDADKNNSYIVQVRATDNGVPALFDTEFVTVTVTNVNEAPTLSTKGPFSTPENKTAVATLAGTDPDTGAKLTFSLSGGADASLFTLTPGGVLSFTNSPNFEAPADANTDNRYLIEVTLSDGTNSVETPLEVVVTNENEAPVITSPLAVNMPENTTLAETVTATDEDAGSKITYSLVGGADQALFNINATTGALSFKSAPNFELPTDSNKDNKYLVAVRASDGTNFDTETVTVTVTNVNEAPSITSPLALTVNENITAVGTVTGSDPDAGTKLSYSIVGGADAALFAIDPASGKLAFLSAPNFEDPADADNNNTYLVDVRLSDGSLSETKTHSIKVANVNEAPVNNLTSPFNLTVTEDVATKLVFPVNSFGDPDAGDTITVLLSVDGGWGTLSGNSTATVTVQSSSAATRTFKGTVANINKYFSDGNVSYQTKLNMTESRNLGIAVTDAGGLKAANFIGVINVTPVNDRPTLTTVNTLTGARRNTPFEITYAMLAAAANEADVDGDPIRFKIQTVSSGTVEKFDGTKWVAVTPGTTLLSSGEKIRWTTTVAGSALNAFTILANDGLLDSLAPAVTVKITATT